MPEAPVDPYDVAIVLGARVEDDGSPSPAMARRVRHAVHLLNDGRVRALLMTGGATTSAVAEAWAMRELAVAAGADPAAIHLEDRARNTIQNAIFSARLLRDRGWRRAVVVTDSFHLPRTWYIFRRFGLRVALSGARPDRPSADWWLALAREVFAIPWTVLRVEKTRLVWRRWILSDRG